MFPENNPDDPICFSLAEESLKVHFLLDGNLRHYIHSNVFHFVKSYRWK